MLLEITQEVIYRQHVSITAFILKKCVYLIKGHIWMAIFFALAYFVITLNSAKFVYLWVVVIK